MKKIFYSIILSLNFAAILSAQNQLQSITKLARQDATSSLVNRDSLYFFYKPGNTTAANQISKIWTNSELIVEPNVNFNPVLRTFADSSVQMSTNSSFTNPLKISWTESFTYDPTYTKLLKNSTYIYYNGVFSSAQTSNYYYGDLIDSVYFYQGVTYTPTTTIALKRYYYKSAGGLTDSIIDKYPTNGQIIKWNFLYNSAGNLTEWKYANPNYTAFNKTYKLFYTGNSPLVDSLKAYDSGGYYKNTYIYTYDANGKWSTISYKDNTSSAYPNGIQWYQQATWGTEVFCNSFDNFNYWPLYQLNSNKNLHDFTATGYLKTRKEFETQPNSNTFLYVTNYNYNTTTTNLKTNKADELNVLIYPNPTADFININFDGKANENQISITDAMGKVVLNKKSVASFEKINLSEFSKGIYFLQLQSGNTKAFRKIIKK